MYIDTVPNRNSPPAILLREGWREGGTVKKRTLANLSKWPPEVVEGSLFQNLNESELGAVAIRLQACVVPVHASVLLAGFADAGV